jgi:D-threo-aldose 1-dehydrogenase
MAMVGRLEIEDMAGAPASPEALRTLGSTGLMVHSLCIGCAEVGNMPEAFDYSVPEEEALAAIRSFLRGPINFLDTAVSYGESERRIGMVLHELGGLPEGVVLATKADRDPITGDFSSEQIRRSVERSLQLLGVSSVQLMYLHDPEHATFEEIMAPGGAVDQLKHCKREGLIEHLGVAGGPIPLMMQYVETGEFEVAISHNRYTLLNVSAAPLWDTCMRHGVAVVNAAPYASGILAKGPSAGQRYVYQTPSKELIERAARIAEVCARHDVPLAAAALQFSMRDPRIVSTIVGMSKPERVGQTLALANHPIPESMWHELADVAPETIDPESNRYSS